MDSNQQLALFVCNVICGEKKRSKRNPTWRGMVIVDHRAYQEEVHTHHRGRKVSVPTDPEQNWRDHVNLISYHDQIKFIML